MTGGLPQEAPRPDRVLDAGEQGCGVLILNISRELAELRPGQVLAVHAYDPLADLDIRCWCKMAGHQLLEAHTTSRPQRFYVRKEGTPDVKAAGAGDDGR